MLALWLALPFALADTGLPWIDDDNDGYPADQDCNDNDPAIHPGATEIPRDGVDQNCNGTEVCSRDGDHDGYGHPNATIVIFGVNCAAAPGASFSRDDCDDSDPAIHPSAVEIPADGVDQNCNGLELCYRDADHDGYGHQTDTTWIFGLNCAAAAGVSFNSDDCDDGDAQRFPGNPEVCDGVDNDCDGQVDQGLETPWYLDADGDGWGTAIAQVLTCDPPPGYADRAGDCNDADPYSNPGRTEIPGDGVDQNCDGYDSCFLDQDGDGQGAELAELVPDLNQICDLPGSGMVSNRFDCDDADPSVFYGAPEVPGDGVDQDCDGFDPPAPVHTGDTGDTAEPGPADTGSTADTGPWLDTDRPDTGNGDTDVALDPVVPRVRPEPLPPMWFCATGPAAPGWLAAVGLLGWRRRRCQTQG